VTVALPAASIVPGTQLPASKKTWFN
jgi:hypothetical protein